jgi:hypothetical protein
VAIVRGMAGTLGERTDDRPLERRRDR